MTTSVGFSFSLSGAKGLALAQTFSKERKLLVRPEFTRCYSEGRRLFSRNFVVFAANRKDKNLPWRLGLAVTRKTGSAVWRNRVKRLVRETFRLSLADLPDGFDFVVVPKRGLDPRRLTLALVRDELLPTIRNNLPGRPVKQPRV